MLLATKANSEEIEQDCGLMSKLNRGGLWFVTENVLNIMQIAESYYRKGTNLLKKHSIEIKKICEVITEDTTVYCKWEEISSQSELKVEKHVSKDLFSSIINLYVRIRSFSYAKDFVQKFKQITSKKYKSFM